MSRRFRVGVIGAGHWGPNIIRHFATSQDTQLDCVCDVSDERRKFLAQHYPGLHLVADPAELLRNPSLDAVVVATPTATHYALAKAALEAGRHVLIEKPVATHVGEARELVEIARRRNVVLMSGHIFLYNLAVRKVKQIVGSDEFGRCYYTHAKRTNLGPIRTDVHAGWDLASHDISIFLYLFGELPVEVTASAQSFVREGIPDVVFCAMYFADGRVAHVHTSWLDPQKVRELTVVGERQMVVFDDMNLAEPIRVYNKGFRRVESTEPLVDTFGSFRVELMQGDVVIPRVSTGEPLRNECSAFVDAIRSGTRPLSDGELGAKVVAVLEALDRSIAAGSRRVPVAWDD